MQTIPRTVSAREFRSNQTRILNAANSGQPVFITSRVGKFKIVPVHEEDSLTQRICKGLEQVKLIRQGKIKGYSIEEALNEL